MIDMKNLTLLGGLTPAEFMRDYWHKKPLLIRQAIPGFQAPIGPEALFKLATSDDVESRLVTHFRKKWELQHGPFDQLPLDKKKDWTLLVQGVNLHDDAADQILRQFNFLPNARLDDLMISYAADGGGVGPHFDSYDVFLLQAHGQRRWRIGAQKDLTLLDNLPLKILRDFKPSQEYVLEPGDMLYLPPHYAHDGDALGECMTYSIGFRAPAYQELSEAFLQFMSDTIDLPGRYADPDLEATTKPAEIGKNMLGRIANELNRVQFTADDIAIFVGEYLSEPKPSVIFASPQRPHTPERFKQLAAKHGVKLQRKSLMLYQGSHVFINGESFAAKRADKNSLVRLANERSLDGEVVASSTDDVQEALYVWYLDGWLDLMGK